MNEPQVTNKSEGWPREPQLDGFFTDYTKIRSRARSIVEPTTGAVIRYAISRNQWDERSPRIRQIRARANLANECKPACWIRFDLLESGGKYIFEDDLWYACDSLSGPLERLASGLIETCAGDIGDILGMGPILHFERLEVRRDLRGTGLGIKIAQCMLSELVDRFNPVLMVLCPYPLQFENCDIEPDQGARARARFEKAFTTSKRKLIRLYERKFGVDRLGEDSDYWGTALSGFGFMQGASGWAVW